MIQHRSPVLPLVLLLGAVILLLASFTGGYYAANDEPTVCPGHTVTLPLENSGKNTLAAFMLSHKGTQNITSHSDGSKQDWPFTLNEQRDHIKVKVPDDAKGGLYLATNSPALWGVAYFNVRAPETSRTKRLAPHSESVRSKQWPI